MILINALEFGCAVMVLIAFGNALGQLAGLAALAFREAAIALFWGYVGLAKILWRLARGLPRAFVIVSFEVVIWPIRAAQLAVYAIARYRALRQLGLR